MLNLGQRKNKIYNIALIKYTIVVECSVIKISFKIILLIYKKYNNLNKRWQISVYNVKPQCKNIQLHKTVRSHTFRKRRFRPLL